MAQNVTLVLTGKILNKVKTNDFYYSSWGAEITGKNLILQSKEIGKYREHPLRSDYLKQ